MSFFNRKKLVCFGRPRKGNNVGQKGFDISSTINMTFGKFFTTTRNLITKKKKGTPLLNYIWKAGAGINIPRTDFTWKGERLNNNFHVAGYNFGVEGGARLYVLKKLFLEGTGKTGYVRYVNALACTPTQKGNRATHGFGYFELIGLIGYDINL